MYGQDSIAPANGSAMWYQILEQLEFQNKLKIYKGTAKLWGEK